MARFAGPGALTLLLLCVGTIKSTEAPRYVGSKTCSLCHQQIAVAQEQTAMANTWQGRIPSWLPPHFSASASDVLTYQFNRTEKAVMYSIAGPSRQEIRLPVEISVGGRRHGLGFLIRLDRIDGVQLARPTLVQARYAWSPENNKLLLAPGCSPDGPRTLEASLGLVLSPTFEKRCLACHGQPAEAIGGHEAGVHCESCHGPGSTHLTRMGQHSSESGILNPKRIPAEESMAVCAQCHVGLSRFSDPSADDLLIANQVRAIRNSECFLQSGKALSCVACHDPHGNGASDNTRALNTCLGCHSQTAKPHAAICPVNAKADCISCHMPSVNKGPLHLVDHLIRVHPEQIVQTGALSTALRTQITPLSEHLRILITDNPTLADSARLRIGKGESFYSVAHETSIDKTAAIGGYLGRKTLSELDKPLAAAAARLNYGETSPVIESGGRWLILQRLPRDFRWQAEELEHAGEDLLARGDAAGAIGKAQSALMIYPHYLRALHLIGTTLLNSGNARKAVDVFRIATNIYPNDGATQFELGEAFRASGDQIAAGGAYEKAIALEPDFVAAYVSLGTISSGKGDYASAARIFRQGLQIDPMCGELYYDLSLALARSGNAPGAHQARALAAKLDPQFSSADRDTAAPRHRSDSF